MQILCMWPDNKVSELDISGIVHYEFVPTGQSQPGLLFGSTEMAACKS